MALQLATESLGEREERDFQRRLENPPSPATERRLLLTAKRFHTVCVSFEKPVPSSIITASASFGVSLALIESAMRGNLKCPTRVHSESCLKGLSQ